MSLEPTIESECYKVVSSLAAAMEHAQQSGLNIRGDDYIRRVVEQLKEELVKLVTTERERKAVLRQYTAAALTGLLSPETYDFNAAAANAVFAAKATLHAERKNG